jgi:hypothetical protein
MRYTAGSNQTELPDSRERPTLCQHCGCRPATLDWVGDGGALAYVHGMSQRWCDYCAIEAQLAYAIQQASTVEVLRSKLLTLGGYAMDGYIQADVWYGPHPCGVCGATIAKKSEEHGGDEVDYPEGPIYPNTEWKPHVHRERGQPVDLSAPPPTEPQSNLGSGG